MGYVKNVTSMVNNNKILYLAAFQILKKNQWEWFNFGVGNRLLKQREFIELG